MANVAIIGAQWGDEGKGKVVDWLASRADIVVRFQGGHNAGHTLVVGNQTYKLSLLPSGVVRGKLGIIGNGVVLDPDALLSEIAKVQAQGLQVGPHNLRIAENTPLILPLHSAIDKAREAARGRNAIGTTGRGIGPAGQPVDDLALALVAPLGADDGDIGHGYAFSSISAALFPRRMWPQRRRCGVSAGVSAATVMKPWARSPAAAAMSAPSGMKTLGAAGGTGAARRTASGYMVMPVAGSSPER